jgi:hypothetical protein
LEGLANRDFFASSMNQRNVFTSPSKDLSARALPNVIALGCANQPAASGHDFVSAFNEENGSIISIVFPINDGRSGMPGIVISRLRYHPIFSNLK